MRKSAYACPERSRRGFTLVELLVVISIIAILSVIGIVIFSGVQKNTRNAKRIADMKAIALALEAYYNDPVNNFKYPYDNLSFTWRTECNITSPGWTGNLSPNDVIPNPGLVPKYMADPFPSDPGMKQTTNISCYAYKSNGKDYALMDYNIGGNSGDDYKKYPPFLDPARDDGSSPCVVEYGMSPREFFAWKMHSRNVSNCGGNDPRTW